MVYSPDRIGDAGLIPVEGSLKLVPCLEEGETEVENHVLKVRALTVDADLEVGHVNWLLANGGFSREWEDFTLVFPSTTVTVRGNGGFLIVFYDKRTGQWTPAAPDHRATWKARHRLVCRAS